MSQICQYFLLKKCEKLLQCNQAQICKSVLYNSAMKEVFLFQNNPRSLVLTIKMDLDFWDCFVRETSVLLPNKYSNITAY